MAEPDGPGSGDSAAGTPFAVQPPSLSLPQGGGALRGLGEKFQANPVTGTGSLSVPIATTAGRGGFGPALALTYDSGSGQGPFGLGWECAGPVIARKTQKGIPRYADYAESDVFLIADAEDLVPVLDPVTGKRPVVPPRNVAGKSYHIWQYRPRIEGLFALIERWTEDAAPANTFWRCITRQNVTTWYGTCDGSRIADPLDASRIFKWLPCQSYDDKGNVILYHYLPEDSRNVDATALNEANRDAQARSANRYLHRIQYGNVKPFLPALSAGAGWPDPDAIKGQSWMFEVVFDYGQCDPTNPRPADNLPWPVRHDAFSSYRAGFEIRTYRLCRRVLMFHHFAELPVADYLVRSTVFSYSEPTTPQDAVTRGYTVLASVTQWAHQWDATAAGYRSRQLPPLELTYSEPRVDTIARSLDPSQTENLPAGIQGNGYQWVDLDGEGLPGVLSEQGVAWHYKPNLGNAVFGAARIVARRPAMAALAAGRQQLLDLAGAGEIDLVDFSGPTPGFHQRDREGWRGHIAFQSLPNLDWADPNMRFIDLTGDGIADILVTADDGLTWYPSLQALGFGSGARTDSPLDEEAGPRLVFADGTQTIFLADMSGDGLTDLLRIRNGDACYWPNLGYGRFGAKVALQNAPVFDGPELFDPRRIRLADIDGSGPSDVVYLGRTGAQLYLNRSGNSLSNMLEVALPLDMERFGSVQVVDLLAQGTACLVWSSGLPGDARFPVRYIDLMADGKPHLLTGIQNNLGGSTQIEYTPSTRFYTQDKLAGSPWITRLPFPVHCVSRTTTTDQWRGTTFSSTFSYHHGYFDGVEREFRGFGRVEQVDAEDYGAAAASNAGSPWVTADKTRYQPPIKTITWYHTGAPLEGSRILGQLAHEYFPARFASRLPAATDSNAFHEGVLPEPALPADLTGREWREAVRACKGMPLRKEVYELDVAQLEADPPRQVPVRLFFAAFHNCSVQRLQRVRSNRHGVFLVTESESLTYHYELDVSGNAALQPDPRVAHTLNLEVDSFGRVLTAAAAVYPRRLQYSDASLTAGQLATIQHVQNNEQHLALSCTRFTADTTALDAYRLGLPCQAQSWEVTGIAPAGAYFTLQELQHRDIVGAGASEIPYQQLADGSAQKRLIDCRRTLFFADNLVDGLPLGQHGTHGLPREAYRLAVTKDLLDDVLTDATRLATALAALDETSGGNLRRSGYRRGDQLFPADPITPAPLSEQWWIASGIAGFAAGAADHFFLPTRYTDPFGNATTLQYDGTYDLYVRSIQDAHTNTVSVDQFDFRIVAPVAMVDANLNRSCVAIDVIGRVVATAVQGKSLPGNHWEADDLDHFDLDLCNPPATTVQAFMSAAVADRTQARQWLDRATVRFLYHFGEQRDGAGNVTAWASSMPSACAIRRERHQPEVDADTETDPELRNPIQIGLQCSDGSGQVLMQKAQAEPATPGGPLRWLINGLTVFNNKGNPVKRYEPAFTAHFGVEQPSANGVTTTTYYDALGRVVRVDSPDGTFSRVEFSPWYSRAFDANDTVMQSQWYADQLSPDPNQPLPAAADDDTRAAWLAAQHAATPSETHFDTLGRPVITILHNRSPDNAGNWQDARYLTFSKLDAEGKPLWIRDARGNLVTQYVRRDPPPAASGLTVNQVEPDTYVTCYDLAGNLLYQHSMDAGDRWMIADAHGKPMLAWDLNDYRDAGGGVSSQRRQVRTDYDSLHRPAARWLTVDEDAAALVEAYEYCDSDQPNEAADLQDAQQRNLLGIPVSHWDPSGLATIVDVDLSGQAATITRTLVQVVADPSAEPALIDWNIPARADLLESTTFRRISEYDALGRVRRLFDWHRGTGQRVAVLVPEYNERGLLSAHSLIVRAIKIDADPGYQDDGAGHTVSSTPVVQVTYNEKGQKLSLELGNGTLSRYTYDANTFRLTHLYTQRNAGTFTGDCSSNTASSARPVRPCGVQNIHYTYDPVGNVTHIQDDAQQSVFFSGALVEPSNDYVYDALYRLIKATGRENAAALAPPPSREGPWPTGSFPSADTLRNYTEQYAYDAVGNFTAMVHVPNTGTGWTRHYLPQVDSNRLDQTWYGTGGTSPVTYHHDPHGNVLNTNRVEPPIDPNNAWGLALRWNWRDALSAIDLGGGGFARYHYGIDNQRTRKHITRIGGYTEDRIYLGDYELYRRSDSHGNVVEEIDTLHLSAGGQCVLRVDDVISSDNTRPDGLTVATQTLFRYQYGNQLDSVCLELDARARIISYEEFHPYGTCAYRLLSSSAEAPPKRYRYTGMERDEESSLGYHRARYYSALLGRWLAVDPSANDLSMCRYGYGGANPVKYTDRSGHAQVPQGATAQSLLDQATSTLALQRLEHLDRGSSQAIIAEAQGSGVVRASNNTFIHHSDDVAKDVASGRRLVSEIDSALGDKRASVSSRLREQLTGARRQLVERLDAVERAVKVARTLNRNPQTSGRLAGTQLPQGRLIEDSLTVQRLQNPETPTLLPDDPQFAGVLDDINRLPVRPGQKAAPPGALKAPVAAPPVEPPPTTPPPQEPPPSGGQPPAGESPPQGGGGPRESTVPEVAGSSFEVDIVGLLAKLATQPLAEKIADKFVLAAVNSILRDINAPEETDIGHSVQGDSAHALLGVAPPGVDIGIATVTGAITYIFSEVAFKPVMVEYYRQYPTPVDFFYKVYGN